jgi:hypothetical protein
LDYYSRFNQWILAPFLTRHQNQESLNAHYKGTRWNLSERYTALGNIIFVSLFYSLINPVGILTAVFAFLCIFAVDRYLLFRRWETGPQIGLSVAQTLRLQILFAIAAHMYASLRVIYSWPMDSASPVYDSTVSVVSSTVAMTELVSNSSNNNTIASAYTYADKYPGFYVFSLQTQSWMSDSQKLIFPIYKAATVATIALVLFVGVIIPCYKYFYRMLFKTVEEITDKAITEIPYSSVDRILGYIPQAGEGTNTVLNASVEGVRADHLPLASYEFDDIGGNLVNIVPTKFVPYVMNVVKQYSVNRSQPHLSSSDQHKDIESSYSNSKGRMGIEMAPRNTPQLSSSTLNSNNSGSSSSSKSGKNPPVEAGPMISTSSLRTQGGFAMDNELLRIINGSIDKSLRQSQHAQARAGRVADISTSGETNGSNVRAAFRSEHPARRAGLVASFMKPKSYASVNPADNEDGGIFDVDIEESAPLSVDTTVGPSMKNSDSLKLDQKAEKSAGVATPVDPVDKYAEAGSNELGRDDGNEAAVRMPEFTPEERRLLCQVGNRLSSYCTCTLLFLPLHVLSTGNNCAPVC